ncbi:MAG: TolC family outer membrane protein [Zoogloeaceae bacterium]|nr:TolC family outer membrane protein [Zoogloeaceae bacterium]
MNPIPKRIAALLAGLVTSSVLAAEPTPQTGPATNLREAAQRAVVSNPEVQARWHVFQAAGNERESARGGYFPRVDLTAGVGTERRHNTGLEDQDFQRRGVTLGLTQMIYDGFATSSDVSRLGYARLTRYYELLDASESAALETLRAYTDVERYRELVKLAEENYVRHRQVFDQIRDRVQAGVGRRVDLEQASGRLALAESNLLTEATNLHDVSARYQRLVGELPNSSLAPVDLGKAELPQNVVEALRNAYSGSPAFLASVENIEAAKADRDVRKARFHPTVDFRARTEVGHNLDGLIGRNNAQVIEVVMNYNLFNGGSDLATVRQYADRVNVAKDQRDKACRDLRQTVSIAYNDVHRLAEQLRYLDQHQLSIAKAREAYRKQFDIGQRTLLDLLDTENEYFQARRAYTGAIYDQTVARGRALAAMGRLLQALDVRRGDLPALVDLGSEATVVDPATACPAEGPGMIQVDKEALLAEAMKKSGGE